MAASRVQQAGRFAIHAHTCRAVMTNGLIQMSVTNKSYFNSRAVSKHIITDGIVFSVRYWPYQQRWINWISSQLFLFLNITLDYLKLPPLLTINEPQLWHLQLMVSAKRHSVRKYNAAFYTSRVPSSVGSERRISLLVSLRIEKQLWIVSKLTEFINCV